MGGFRIAYFGLNKYSEAGTVVIILVTLGILMIFKTKRPLGKKWFLSTIYMTIVSCGVYYYIFPNNISIFFTVYPYFILGTVVVSYTIYKYMLYLNNMSLLYRKLKEEASKDYLTGLNNVREFNKFFRLIIEKAVSNNQKFSLLLLDIDFFKKINDTHGHQAGDKVLKEIGKILRQSCRADDKIREMAVKNFQFYLRMLQTEKLLR